tara:strand:- start:55 stop:915 length:861 start_codon:yes stop_codon:yes gene_type:complete
MKKSDKKIGIIGHGFVGKATDWGFKKNVEKFIVDPNYKTTIDQLADFNPDVVFICVPTPMRNDGGQNYEILQETVYELNNKCSNTIKVIKSTVLPSVLEKLEKNCTNIVYNPEFLREKSANYDFENSEMLIFGGQKSLSKKVSKIYKEYSVCKTEKHVFCDIKTASFIKYAINTFLASKVTFFNELHEIFIKMNVKDDWTDAIESISTDSRIGSSHMNVPGHDGKKGFGGACFPKDTIAFVKFATENNVDLDILKRVIEKNNMIRSQYSNLDPREVEQNISFSDKI